MNILWGFEFIPFKITSISPLAVQLRTTVSFLFSVPEEQIHTSLAPFLKLYVQVPYESTWVSHPC